MAADGKIPPKSHGQAGSAAVTITPEHLMWMSGYAGRDKPADGKITELWAKALVLQNSPENRAVLVTLDFGRHRPRAVRFDRRPFEENMVSPAET
ncbi:MAG: hypothetical protein R3C99_04380 [Pirellulaceae bacterium]